MIANTRDRGREQRAQCGIYGADRSRLIAILIFAVITIACLAAPVAAISSSNTSAPAATAPQQVNISIYVVDFNRFDVGAGSVGVDCYVNFKSDKPVSISDFELMNGMINSVTTIKDTPLEKEYRVIAVLTAEPDLSRYPFDRHVLTIRFEPKLKNEREMIFSIDQNTSGVSPEADLPGWQFTGTKSTVTNTTYLQGEIPYSRAVFDYGITRDATSTVLKFFLPLLLIVIVSLSSLLMKTTSRLGLNASMFLAAVLIHWRIADAIPLVNYATFLDLFMIITYATLVMVLISGVLNLMFIEKKEFNNVDRVNFWSIRIIPPVTILLYCAMFLSLLK